MNSIEGLLTILGFIPALRRWFEKALEAYIEKRIEEMKRENAQAMQEMREKMDQRPIERLLNENEAGKQSQHEGTEIRTSLPGIGPH